MTHLPEPFHSLLPGLDPAREATPPAHLRVALLAAVADSTHADGTAADGTAAPRPFRRRPILTLLAACLVMVAAAGLVAHLRQPATQPATTAVRFPGIEDRTPAGGASLPRLTGCPGGFALANSAVADTVGPGQSTPQAAVLEYETTLQRAAPSATSPAYKLVQETPSTVTARYFDSRGRVLVQTGFARQPDDSWHAVGMQTCVRRGVPERTDLRFGAVKQRCPGLTKRSMIDYVAGAGEPSPQLVVDALEKSWLPRALGSRAASKVVERGADRWRLLYLDAGDHYIGGVDVSALSPGHWVMETTSACEPT